MPLNIVFMGTPDFAVPCLDRLIQEGHRVRAVFCQPDRPKGRGHKLVPPPVKTLALERDIPVHQPVKMRDGQVRSLLEGIAPDLIVVVAYGRLLPADLLGIPRLGCINVHASLLPKYRGAAPIQWAVIGGESVTGVCTMYMAEELDAGDVILTKETPIGPEETAGELFVRLSELGAQCLAETVPLLEQGNAPRTPQDGEQATFAPMIQKSMGNLDFTLDPQALCRLVRGLSPSPGAFLTVGDTRVKVLLARPAQDASGAPGELLSKKRFLVGCGQGAVELVKVQPQGKKAMEGSAFVNGRRLEPGEMLTAQ